MRFHGCAVGFAAGAMLLVGLGVGAAPFNAGRVAPGARWVAHADLDQLRKTEVGREFISLLSTEEAGRKFAAFALMFGFDPRNDLSEVTLYGADDKEENSAALVRGRLNAEHLVTLVRAGDSYTAVNHEGVTIHGWTENKAGRVAPSYGAIAPDGTVVISRSAARVREALDVLAGRVRGGGAFRSDPAGAGATFFIGAADLAHMERVSPNAAILRQASAAALLFGEAQGDVTGTLRLRAADETIAGQIEAVARGTVAFAILGRESNPELAALAEASSVVRNGTEISLNLRSPVARALDYLRAEAARKQAQQAASGPAPQR